MKWRKWKEKVAASLIGSLLFTSVAQAVPLAADGSDAGKMVSPSVSVPQEEKLPEWASASIRAMLAEGIMKGYEDGAFRPNRLLTRAEFVSITNRLGKVVFSEDGSATAALSYRDVGSEWFAEDVYLASRRGYVEGFPDGSFRPDAPVNRQEAAVMLNRIFKLVPHDKVNFTDLAKIPEWAQNDVAALTRSGLIEGFPDGSFGGEKQLTRAEAAVLFSRIGTWHKQEEKKEEEKEHPISLHVSASNGQPLSGAAVSVHVKGERSILRWGRTNEQGHFEASLPYGQYEAAVQSEGLATHQAFNFNEETANINLTAEKAAVFSGKLIDKAGQPKAGVAVSFTTNPTFFALTQTDGSFKAYVLPERNYHAVVIERTSSPMLTLYKDAIPDSLAKLGQKESKECGCRLQELHKPLSAPKSGETADIGTWSLADINAPSTTGGGNGGGQSGGGNGNGNNGGNVPDRTAPSVPTQLTARSGSDSVGLQWQSSPETDVAGYLVYRSENDGGSWSRLPETVTHSQYTVTQLTYGTIYTFAVSAIDQNGNESAKSDRVRASLIQIPDTAPPAVPMGLLVLPKEKEVNLQWDSVHDADLSSYHVYMSINKGLTWEHTGTSIAPFYTVTQLTYGPLYTFAVSAVDLSGNESNKSTSVDSYSLPPVPDESSYPDPAPTPISLAGEDTFSTKMAFLYEGSQPIQKEVEPGALESQRLAVLKGTVLNEEGQPLSGVKITILDHPDWGYTRTRADGHFDLAVNGGGHLIVIYDKDGYMSIQRKTNVPWEDYVILTDVTLKAYDSKVTSVQLSGMSTEIQVAQGNPVSDNDGSRQATLLILPETTAYMKLPDGTTQSLPQLHVRATEYTVGDKGPQAMPGDLPSYVGYTYAVELSADEAVGAGATEVRFSQPLYTYVDNFLGFPVGEVVPSGYYDRQLGEWVSSTNGKIIQILRTEGGIAAIDSNGDGLTDDGTQLATIGMTAAEQMKLAELYQDGKTLWRVPIEHFTPWDFNWPYGPPNDAILPPHLRPNYDNPDINDNCKKSGSIIGCQEQTLGESIPITGTSLTLNYYSRRAEGYKSKSTLEIPVINGPLPASLTGISLEIHIAGKKVTQWVSLSQGTKPVSFNWDGKDAYGRQLIGSHSYKVIVKYHYRPQYYASSAAFDKSFGQPGMKDKGVMIGLNRTAATLSTEREWNGLVESPVDVYQEMGIAGWSLDGHEAYNSETGALSEGSGSMRYRDQGELAAKLIDFRSTATGGIGSSYKISIPSATTIGPDGDIYVNTYMNTAQNYPNNVETQVFRMEGDGSDARNVTPVQGPLLLNALIVDSEGTLYGTSWGTFRIWRKKTSETSWVPIAGTGSQGQEYSEIPSGIPALEANLHNPVNLAISPDGSLYFTDGFALCRIDSDGMLTSYGDRTWKTGSNNGADSGPFTKETIGVVDDVVTAPDGSLYVLDTGGCSFSYCAFTRIRKISVDGSVSLFAGAMNPDMVVNFVNGMPAKGATFRTAGNQLHIDNKGNLIFMREADNGDRQICQITPEGTIREFASDQIQQLKQKVKDENGTYSGSVYINMLAVGPRGEVIVQVQHSKNPPDYFSLYRIDSSAQDGVTDEAGLIRYEFDPQTGRQLSTNNALTGSVVSQFAYDDSGRLTRMLDRVGNALTIERSSDGTPTAIITSGGQRTTLQIQNGQLIRLSNPLGESYQMQYDATGLLKQFTDPNGHVRRYGYDSQGYLTRAENPLEGVSTLERTNIPNGYKVTYTRPGNEITSFEVSENNGQLLRVSTDSAGARTVSKQQAGGAEEIQYPDGTQVVKQLGLDPRWGSDAPQLSNLLVTTPSGRVWKMSESRKVNLRVKHDPYSVQSVDIVYTMSETSSGGTKTSSSSVKYDALEKKFIETSAEAQVTTTYLDALDRVWKIEEPGSEPLLYTYDTKGLLVKIEQGEQFLIHTYNDKNQLISTSDATGLTKRFTYDAAGREITIQLPSGQIIGKQYDAVGNVTAIVMPDGTVYDQSYDELDKFNGFSMAGGESAELQVAFTTSGKMEKSILPGGRQVNYGYDTVGRINGLSDPDVQRLFSYAGNLDLVSTMESLQAANPANRQSIAYTYDGSDVTGMNWFGKANGQFAYKYDGYSNLTNIRMTAGAIANKDIPLSWDKDGNLAKFGPFAFNRNSPGKRVASIADGTMDIGVKYDAQGRISELLYMLQGEAVSKDERIYDLSGKMISQTTTTSEGVESVDYIFDQDGQLLHLSRTDALGTTFTENYTYDVNRNRVSREVTGSALETSSYGDYDAIIQSGSTSYHFNADGYLTSKGDDTFHYGARGELLEAVVDGQTFTYTYDGLGRRTARDVQGKTTQYLYGNPLAPQSLTAVIGEDQSVTTYFYNENGLLLALERDGVRYYVITDTVGTPTKVLKGDKTIVKEIRYDSYGVLLADTNPSFVLDIGFAGGLHDSGTKLVRFGFRDYDPEAGRWTARDPILYDSGQANLYNYVNNNPIQLRDPCGLFCVGASAYEGVGGGGKFCITDEGVSGCAEVGFGIGTNVEVNPGEDLSSTGISAELSLKAAFGPVSYTNGLKISSQFNGDCPKFDFISKAKAGPFGVDFMSPSKSGISSKFEKTDTKMGDLFKGSGFKAEAALKTKGCAQYKW
ncbi:hypothetical protein ASG89_14170 [Paenibacillus sp. Soil766]|uniref:S-layer homology domain-containing protein n=1 Tax=Paenibacillus sp. Soil766 TaxID=1736404 RepID=UPI0007090477|nr:S-layer homology domain-containing protein [Paenibacillus sp. Soil766]KRE82401.1 hypothetical protein ASG89_14170 [Paenibacillus sp. Soil766]